MLKFLIFTLLILSISCFQWQLKKKETKKEFQIGFFNRLKQKQRDVFMPQRFREKANTEVQLESQVATQTSDSDSGVTLNLKEFRFKDDKLMISYYGEVGIGEDAKSAQRFKVLFDTGSTDFFIPDESCQTPSCMSHNKYKKTKTYHALDVDQQEIEYISGSLKSNIASDNIFLGDILVKEQTLHLGYEVYIPIFDSAEWDGIVGLGFTPSNEKPVNEEHIMATLVDNLEDHDDIKNKFFSFYLPGIDLENEGYITFGEVPSDIVDDESKIEWAPLIPENENPWSVRLSDIVIQQSNRKTNRNVRNNASFLQTQFRTHKFRSHSKNGIRILRKLMNKMKHRSQNPCGKEGCELLIDTGTYLTYVPREMYKHFFKDFDSSNAENCDAMDELPDIHFVVIGEKKNFDLILEPKDYVIKYTDENDRSTCVLGISPDDEVSHLITIGQELLRAFTTIFDFDNKQIGFYDMSENQDDDSTDDE